MAYTFSPTDQQEMRRALRIASLGRHASPNPMVGCTILNHDGVRVGEGYHIRPGTAHAETVALASASSSVRGGTAYVTLEPCSHFGRTPPCADALISAGINRVVVAVTDPDSRVSGTGVARLRDAGVHVDIGLCESMAATLNSAYFKHRTMNKPWVVLKIAMSLDGKIATHTGDSQWISSSISRQACHRQLRDRCDAILTGVGTILADDPSLTTRLRYKQGRNPYRVVMDTSLRTPIDSNVVKRAEVDRRTILIVSDAVPNDKIFRFEDAGCIVLRCPLDPCGRVSSPAALTEVGTRHDFTSVLLESGPQLSASFIENGLVDRVIVYMAPLLIGGNASHGPIGDIGVSTIADALKLDSIKFRKSGVDIVVDGRFVG